jgi:hypothetical protein
VAKTPRATREMGWAGGGRIWKRGLCLIFAAGLRSWVMARPVRRKRVPIPADNADDDERAPSEEQHHGADHDQHHDEVHGHRHGHGDCGQSARVIIIMGSAPI